MKRIERLGDDAWPENVKALDAKKEATAAAGSRVAAISELTGLCAETQRLVTSTRDQLAHLATRGGDPREDRCKHLLLKIVHVEARLAGALTALDFIDRDPTAALTALDGAITEMLDAEEAQHRPF